MSYITANAVKFLVDLQSGNWTGHQQVASCVTGLRVCSQFNFNFGADVIRTFLTTSCFADIHRVTILHTPGRR